MARRCIATYGRSRFFRAHLEKAVGMQKGPIAPHLHPYSKTYAYLRDIQWMTTRHLLQAECRLKGASLENPSRLQGYDLYY